MDSDFQGNIFLAALVSYLLIISAHEGRSGYLRHCAHPFHPPTPARLDAPLPEEHFLKWTACEHKGIPRPPLPSYILLPEFFVRYGMMRVRRDGPASTGP